MNFVLGFNGAIFLVEGDVPVDSETHVVTSSISRFAGLTQFFGGAHKSRIYVRAFIGVSVRVTESKKTKSPDISIQETILFRDMIETLYDVSFSRTHVPFMSFAENRNLYICFPVHVFFRIKEKEF
jgi:hypothetical protein